MENFEAYLAKLEYLGFFSGFPLVYAFVIVVSGKPELRNQFKKNLAGALPYAYALTGTLFLGYMIRNWYPNFNMATIRSVPQPFLFIWAIGSLLFWIPAVNKIRFLCLLHSLLFFTLALKNILFPEKQDPGILSNTMKVYTDSILLNLGTLSLVLVGYYLFTMFRKKARS